MARLLEGDPVAERIKKEIRQQVEALKIKPLLASVIVGENPGAESYVRSQAKVAQELGIEYRLHELASSVIQSNILDCIQKLNVDKSVHGIIIQSPLPAQADYKKICNFIDPKKDVEGVHPDNIGRIISGQVRFVPCTACAVMELISASKIDLCGKEVVIVGHSEIVGKPLAILLLDRLATVTVCHIGTSRAGKLEEHVNRAEVLIVAAGKAGLIKGDWVKDGAVVIDVGINRTKDRIVGDVEFEAAEKKASYITPVPGGVGPLTVTMLMRNLIEAVKLQQQY